MKRKATKPNTRTAATEIMESLAEFTAALKADDVLSRLTCRQIKVKIATRRYSAKRVKELRQLLGYSQPLFAEFLGVSPKTVRSWEQGTNPPSPIACRFMDEIRGDLGYWKERITKSFAGGLPVG